MNRRAAPPAREGLCSRRIRLLLHRPLPAYGDLAHVDKPGLREGARIDSDRYDKEDIRDFVLWKAWTEADGSLAWDSPWGRGRPRLAPRMLLHVDEYLGRSFDIHTGGVDLVFPHHQNEIAQRGSHGPDPVQVLDAQRVHQH